MSGSTLGKNFTITTWGESHGPALGVVVDGCPAGLGLTTEHIQRDLDRRKPGNSPFATPRKEADEIQILSGVYQGKTTGTPISLVLYNTNQRSYDYTEIAKVYRPGHADYAYDQKYGFRDVRGGGRSSGRETAARVAGGAVAKRILSELGVSILTYTLSIGPITIDRANFSEAEITKNHLAMPDALAAQAAADFLIKQKEQEDSTGGEIECVVTGLPSGVGEPVFDKLDATLAKAIFSIGAVKAVQIGSGTSASTMSGSQHNDFMAYNEDGELTKLTNYAGGIVGGISDGFPLTLRASIKPTPSIHKRQQTVSKQGENVEIQVEGRHDPIIVPRAVVVVEAMVAVTLVDYLLQRILSHIDLIKKTLPS